MSDERLRRTTGYILIMCGVALLAVAALELLAGRYISFPWSAILGVVCAVGGILSMSKRRP